MSRFCTNCGNELADNVLFCTNCGASIENKSVDPQKVAVDPISNEPQYHSSNNDNTNSYSEAYNGVVVEDKPSPALAIVSLICGILSILCCCSKLLGSILALTALTCGIISIATKKGGKGMAIAGIICSSLGLIGTILLLVGAGMTANALGSAFDLGNIEYLLEDLMDSL